GKLRVSTIKPADMPHDPAGLLAFRAVVLENVPAGQAGPQALGALTRFVTDLGGGLLLTGGPAAFGVGGYFKSVLDPFLPVSMEVKNEHRKLSLAMAVALDRSGSMAAPASEKDRICDEVRRIQSMGGGIFTYTALVTAAKIVQESDKGTRHIVLFADAADAEEPGEYERLLA